MPRRHSSLGPALLLAAVTLAASSLMAAFPRSYPVAVAACLLLAVAVIALDLVAPSGVPRVRRGPTGTLLLAGAIVVAAVLVGEARELAAMVPIFAGCAATSLLLRTGRPGLACRGVDDGGGGARA